MGTLAPRNADPSVHPSIWTRASSWRPLCFSGRERYHYDWVFPGTGNRLYLHRVSSHSCVVRPHGCRSKIPQSRERGSGGGCPSISCSLRVIRHSERQRKSPFRLFWVSREGVGCLSMNSKHRINSGLPSSYRGEPLSRERLQEVRRAMEPSRFYLTLIYAYILSEPAHVLGSVRSSR
jgi:hypothetical protein